MACRASGVVWLVCVLAVAHAQQQSVVREVLAGRQVYEYRSYKDVQIFHFSVPPRVTEARFNFTANDTLACNARNITAFLQAESYPVVNPDGAAFPKGLWINRSQVFEVHLQSNLKPALLSVLHPLAGDWYMVAFINDTSNRITQAGLFPSCHSWLQTKVEYQQLDDLTTIVPQTPAHPEPREYMIQGSNYYRFYVASPAWMVAVNVSRCEVSGEDVWPCPVTLALRRRALPHTNASDTLYHECGSSEGSACVVETAAEEESWHYLQVAATNATTLLWLAVITHSCVENTQQIHIQANDLLTPQTNESFSIEENLIDFNLVEISMNDTGEFSVTADADAIDFSPRGFDPKCWPRHQLVKKTFGGNFVFEFDLPPNENGSVPLLMNITNDGPTILTFALEPIIDIGGTLSLELAVSPFMNVSQHNFSVSGCVSHRVRGDVGCAGGHSLLVNTTSLAHAADAILIPFPQPGPWFLTLAPRCFLNHSSEPVECTVNETTVLFSVTSASCIDGKCGKYGECFQYISSGYIFSTCICDAGYRGWACTDSSQAMASWVLLLATLLLTLSNLCFLPAIVLAVRRKHFAEAVVYTFTMFFSAFYHACDQEPYNFCLIRLSVLQFCDFYSAIFSFWVTLIAMADIPHSLYSLLHVTGAMVVAAGVEYDRTGLWVFVVPATSAFLVMASSWVWHCKQQHGCYPNKRYWLVCLLPGVLLSCTGLLCYAFLETHDNYYYVHSLWHATMALAILCLMPPRRDKHDSCSDEETVSLPDGDGHITQG